MIESASVGVFALIVVRKQIVLVRHAYGTQGLSLPGGGLATGETPDIAIRREVFEETGIDVPLLRHIGTFFLRKSAGVVFLFFGSASIAEKASDSLEEISEIILADSSKLPIDIYPAQRKLIERWSTNNLGDENEFHLL